MLECSSTTALSRAPGDTNNAQVLLDAAEASVQHGLDEAELLQGRRHAQSEEDQSHSPGIGLLGSLATAAQEQDSNFHLRLGVPMPTDDPLAFESLVDQVLADYLYGVQPTVQPLHGHQGSNFYQPPGLGSAVSTDLGIRPGHEGFCNGTITPLPTSIGPLHSPPSQIAHHGIAGVSPSAPIPASPAAAPAHVEMHARSLVAAGVVCPPTPVNFNPSILAYLAMKQLEDVHLPTKAPHWTPRINDLASRGPLLFIVLVAFATLWSRAKESRDYGKQLWQLAFRAVWSSSVFLLESSSSL